MRTSNKRVIEHLICAGAFDTMPGTRAQKVNELEKIMDLAAEHKKVAATGQMGLFMMGDPTNTQTDETSDDFIYQMIPDWSEKEKLEKEKEVIGFYLSAHPLESYKKLLRCVSIEPFDAILKKGQFDAERTRNHRILVRDWLKASEKLSPKKVIVWLF